MRGFYDADMGEAAALGEAIRAMQAARIADLGGDT
jgi:hypothetical protein